MSWYSDGERLSKKEIAYEECFFGSTRKDAVSTEKKEWLKKLEEVTNERDSK